MKAAVLFFLLFVSFNPLITLQLPTVQLVDQSVVKHKIEQRAITKMVAARYKIDHALARDIVSTAFKYERQHFPKAIDIIAIIGIESAFRPHAKSALKTDPAIGLTQVRPGAWSHKIAKSELHTIDGQIRIGADILSHYYTKLDGNKSGAIGAYNVGLRGYVERKNPAAVNRYVAKYTREVANYK